MAFDGVERALGAHLAGYHARVHALRLLASVLALSSGGCTLVAATRSPSAEQGADACANFVDDDLDGRLDCDDPECDGLCPEETLGPCTDGRDNDGDSVVDAEDVRCWGVAAPRVTSCASVRGSVVMPAIDGSSLVWRGIARQIADPRGGAGFVLAPVGREFRVAPVATTTGALDGLRLHATLRLTNAVETAIELVPAGQIGDATATAVFPHSIAFVIGAMVALCSEAGCSPTVSSLRLAGPTWVDVEIAMDGRYVTASIGLGAGSMLEVARLAVPAGLVDPAPLDVLVSARSLASSDVPMLASLRVERPYLPACDRAELVPEIRTPPFDLVLDVARGGGDGAIRCAISSENGLGRPYVALGDGDWQPGALALVPRDLMGVAFDWDPARDAFVGIAALGSDLGGGRDPEAFLRIESADCASWTTVSWTLPRLPSELSLFARGASYVVAPDGAHVLRLLGFGAGEIAIVTLRSLGGEPSTFSVVGEPRALGPDAETLAAESARFGLEQIGRDDVVLLATSPRGLVALTPRGDSGRFVLLASPLLAPSDVLGTFDRGTLFGPPRLVPSRGAESARIFYAGFAFGDCTECVTSGSGLFAIGGGP